MTYAAIAIAAVVAMRLTRYVKPGAVAFAVPALLLAWYAWTRTTLSTLSVWFACVVTLAVLWKDDRG